MNKTIKLKTLLLVGLCLLSVFLLHVNLGLFTRYNYITGLYDKMNSNYKLVIIGDTPNQVANYAIAAQEFGFEYIFYGCIVSEPAMQGIQAYNKVMYKALTETNGTDWEQELIKTINYLNEE